MHKAIRHSFAARRFAAAAVAAALGASLAPSSRADSTWIGPRISTDPAAWNSAENWNGGVPTGSTKAIVTYDTAGTKSYALFFTPPLDFTGQISVSRDSTTWDTRMPNYLKLTVLDGATWTVTGSGHLIATDGIADRIASTFYGTIVIPPSASFTAPATLHTDVEFTGKGTLTLTTTNQLSHISGFSGTLVWNGPEGASLTPVDIAVLQQHGIRLGNGASINLRDRFLAINGVHKIPDWNDAASDWSFNGTNSASSTSSIELDTNPPHANAAGELELVNDAGQVHSVFYKGFRLKMHDSWGVSFRWTPGDDLPQKYIDAGKYQDWSGMFGFYLVADPTTYGTLWQPGGTGHGFAMDFWNSRAGWQRNDSPNINPGAVSFNREMLSAFAEGFDFHEAADVDISCQNGTLTVTMTQGDKMFSVQRPTFNQQQTLELMPDGYYIGFAASSDHWEDKPGEPLVTHTISDFRGWYRAREAHGWQNVADSVYPFTSANCTARIYTTPSNYVDNAAALESDGSFRLEPYGSATRNIIRSNYSFDRNKKYLVQFDLVAGTGTSGENTEFTKMGFVKTDDPVGSWVFGYNAFVQEFWDGYAYPITLATYWYGGWSRFGSNGATPDSARATIEVSQKFTTPKMVKETTTHVGFLYDGRAGVYYQAHSGKHSMDIGWIPSEFIQSQWFYKGYPVRFQISHGNSWGQVDTVLKNFSIKRLDSPDTSFIDGEIAVAPNATATLRADASAASSPVAAAQVRKVSLAAGSELAVATDVAGSRVEIDSVAVSGDGAEISSTATTTLGGSIEFSGDVPATGALFSGDVTFASGTAEIVVPESWRSANDPIPLFTLSSTTSGTLPSGYRLVTDAGEDITGKSRVSVVGNAVRVCFKSPFMIIMR